MPMKRSFRDSRCASFTLAELLIAMGVIVVLVILVFVLLVSSIGPIGDHRLTAQTMATQIQTACLGYYNDYGTYPIPTNTPAGTQPTYGIGDTNDWKNLIWALCGNINPYDLSAQTPSVPNPRAT